MIIGFKHYVEMKKTSPVSFSDKYFVPYKGKSGDCLMTLDHNPMTDTEALDYAIARLDEMEAKPAPAEGQAFQASAEGTEA